MNWSIVFYSNRVMKDIQEWPPNVKAKFSSTLQLIKELGPQKVGMPHIKAMKMGLFEIRVSGSEGIGRAFFCMSKGRVIVILGAFIKKTQKTPQKELELALKRMNEVKKDE